MLIDNLGQILEGMKKYVALFKRFFATAFSMSRLQRVKFVDQKFRFLFWGLISILLPSILGGMRAGTLGTDNIRYTTAFLSVSEMTSPIQAIVEGPREPGYELLSYLVSRFTTDYHWLCFITELITITFIVAGLYYYRNNISLALGILVYLFLQYCNCINLVRQGIALAIVFFAMKYAEEEKFIKYLILILIAATFHTSAIIGLLIFFIYKIMKGKYPIRNLFFIGIFLFIIVACSYNIVSYLVYVGILGNQYLAYVAPGIHFSFWHSVFCLPVLAMATAFYKVLSNKFAIYKFLYALLWCEIIVVQLADVFDPAYRLSLYFGYSSLVVLPMLPKAFKEKTRLIAVGIVIVYIFVYWCVFTVFNKYGFKYPVYPYVTDLF